MTVDYLRGEGGEGETTRKSGKRGFAIFVCLFVCVCVRVRIRNREIIFMHYLILLFIVVMSFF